ncbi:hypothetical protein BpHYR1_011393 [Brachionus plicatilis]|uniref:Ferritin/DPS domain-containing protein n=1 Tax=Brachionus plicatilis TaxID=10195 RepID=A0A3M7Q4Q5_BRAPC|nr:hypothetical protein BpHYR1_011393 [Brachionus plicatilis]
MSQAKTLTKETEEKLNHFFNYLKYFSDKCTTLSSISHLHYGGRYGLCDFFNWCAQDLNKMDEKVVDYIKQRNGQVNLIDLIASKFDVETEKKVDLHSLTPYELVDYLHKEDTRYNDLLNDFIRFADKQKDEELKQFFASYKDELTNWNKKIDDSLITIRKSTTSSKLTEDDLHNVFQNQFDKIRNFREI